MASEITLQNDYVEVLGRLLFGHIRQIKQSKQTVNLSKTQERLLHYDDTGVYI